MAKKLLKTLDDCDEEYGTLMSATGLAEKRRSLARLLEVHQILNFGVGRSKPFWRARKCPPDGWPRESDLHHPPAAATSAGRLNDPGEPCLYTSVRWETALAEIHAGAGDYVQLAGYRVLTDKMLRTVGIGEWQHVQKTGYLRTLGTDPDSTVGKMLNSYPHEKGMLLLYVDALLGSILADPLARQNDYVNTRLLRTLVYKKIPATAIFYPSVQDSLGMNLAIGQRAAHECTHGCSSMVIKVVSARKFGIYEFEVVKNATGVASDGTFEWGRLAPERSMRLYRMTAEEHRKGGKDIMDLHSERHTVKTPLRERIRDAIAAFKS